MIGVSLQTIEDPLYVSLKGKLDLMPSCPERCLEAAVGGSHAFLDSIPTSKLLMERTLGVSGDDPSDCTLRIHGQHAEKVKRIPLKVIQFKILLIVMSSTCELC